jgi:hypothetical protein
MSRRVFISVELRGRLEIAIENQIFERPARVFK